MKHFTNANGIQLGIRNLDPFLMLDEFEGDSKEGAGFPDHPHRLVNKRKLFEKSRIILFYKEPVCFGFAFQSIRI